MQTILIVDDDTAILEMVSRMLNREGYHIIRVQTAEEVIKVIGDITPDLLLLDIGLPGLDGVSLCGELRQNPDLEDMPILFLSGQEEPDKVAEALNVGGDDYIRKPFAIRELAARIRAHLRRAGGMEEDAPTLRLLPATHQVFVNDELVSLTPVEFDLLNYLCQTPNEWHTTQTLLADVWDYPEDVGDAALVRNHIRNLRRKLESNPDRPSIILSRHRRGYIIRARVENGDDET